MDEQQALNAPYVLNWNGRALKFGGLEQQVKAACVSAAKLAARLEHDENMRLFYSDDDAETKAERREAEREFKEWLITGRFQWKGDLRRGWQRSAEGVACFVSAALEAGGTPLPADEIEQLIADKPAEMLAVMSLVDWDVSNIDNPNAKRPAELMTLAATMGIQSGSRSSTCMPDSSASHSI